MKPPLNLSKKTQTIQAGSLKILWNTWKSNWSLVTEGDRSKTNSKTVKLKM